MNPQKIRPNYTDNAALRYDVQSSPLNRDLRFVAGSNVLTSIKGYAERRPGFPSALETGTPTVFTTARRIFGWRKWNGPFYIIVNEVTSSQSKLYYYIPGLSTVFTLFYTGSSARPYDFVTFNDSLFFANGSDMGQWDGNTTTSASNPGKWGVDFPTAPPTVTLSATAPGNPSAAIGYSYVYCYETVSGQISSPSPASTSTGAFDEELPTITGAYSTDGAVFGIKVFRTTDGGGAIYFQLPGEIVNNTGGGTWSITDQNTDIQLFSETAPPAAANDPPSALAGVVEYASRLWGYKNDQVWFSNNEEQTTGIAWQSFTPTNYFRFGAQVTAIQPVDQGLLVHCVGPKIFKITGDSLDTFRKDPFISNMGTLYNTATALVGKAGAWLDNGNTMRISDGYTQREFSLDIRPDIASIDQSQAYLCYHPDGRYQLGILMDGAAGKLRVYDMDTEQWMPPWSVSGTAIASVLTGPNTRQVLIAHSSGKILAMNYTAYNDNGTAYTATATTSLAPISAGVQGMGHSGVSEYVVLETGSTRPSTVEILKDDDPTGSATVTFLDITANIATAPLRSQGANLYESWYYDRSEVGRKTCVRLTWPVEDANFKLYGLNIAGSDFQTNAG
jgi:hypothetical protein